MKQENNEGHLSNTNSSEEKESSSSAMKRSHDETTSNESHLNSQMAAPRPNNQFSRDPREVLRASLEFEQSTRRLEQQRYLNSRLPPRFGSESSLITSTSSLYPSLESVHRAAGDLDFEADWSSANVSERRTVASTSQDAATPLVQATTSLLSNIHTSISTPVAVSSAIAEPAAEVTIIEDGTVHPLEVESVVQAELLNEGANDNELHPESTANQTQQPGDAAEATVIESGPAEKATVAAWSGHSTEVVTLPQESFESVDVFDAKNSSQNETGNHANALSRELSVRDLLNRSEHANGGMVALVDVFNDSHSTRAEFVGLQASHSTLGELAGSHSTLAEFVEDSSTNELVSERVTMVTPTGDDNDPNVATEATVLDCGPPEKATVDAWSAPEEAQVLSDDCGPNASTYIEEGEIIPSACVDTSAENFSTTDDDRTGIRDRSRNSDNQVEIVEISDHIHPLELEMENATTAQLIGNPEGAIPVSDGVNAESTVPDFFTEQDTTNQAPLIPSIEARNDNEDDVGSQELKLPATMHEDEIIPLATIDGEQIQVDPLRQTMASNSDNLDNSAVLVPTETSAIQSEVLGVFQVGTTSASEYIEGPQVPEPRPFASAAPSSLSHRSSTDSSERNRSGVQVIQNVIEKLFGDTNPIRNPVSFEMDSFTTSVSPRIQLPSSVIHSDSTNSWVVTLSISQKAIDGTNVAEISKALRAFEVPTEKQAKCLANAWTPPKMHPFSSNPQCFICRSQFAVLRRPCHCRNCGVCICNACTVQWPSQMIPSTYNIKGEAMVNVCKACDWLSSSFRKALLQGERDKAIALHATGNVNLTTPFANIKGEVFYPVHCAVLGKSLWLLKWLVDDNCCPLRSIRIGSGGIGSKKVTYTPILTSKSRTLLNIALTNNSIDIMRYLVVEKHMQLHDEKNLPMETLLQNLDSILRVLPTGNYDLQTQHETLNEPEISDGASYDNASTPASMGGSSEYEITNAWERNDSSGMSPSNECILCCSNEIDCVIMPCGHQMCCMECSTNMSRCPVCQQECSFVRVYRG